MVRSSLCRLYQHLADTGQQMTEHIKITVPLPMLLIDVSLFPVRKVLFWTVPTKENIYLRENQMDL